MLDLVVLGIVQGLTEFLPVSSTAHLLFAEHYLGMSRPGLVLEAALHLGTVLAACVLFWPDVVRIVRSIPGLLQRSAGPGKRTSDPWGRMAVAIGISTAVTAALGLTLAGPLERMFESIRATAAQLLITGLILLWSRERGVRSAGGATVRDGVVLGLAQALAIVPGISRSGVTIVAGLALGLRRTEAARLSFLMSIPAIAGASVFALKDVRMATRMGYGPLELLVGAVVAGISGGLAIVWLVDLIRRQRLIAFSAYCWLVGLLVLLTAR
ncbi:MAG: undecaprenyl-diphosphate phosphatase [bacterium]|nr:undecaprenyl-diphosphate phosphatase [bacterium]